MERRHDNDDKAGNGQQTIKTLAGVTVWESCLEDDIFCGVAADALGGQTMLMPERQLKDVRSNGGDICIGRGDGSS